MRIRLFIGALALVTALVFDACGFEGSEEDAWAHGYARGYEVGERLDNYYYGDLAEIADAPADIQGRLEEQADRAFWNFAMMEAAAASLLKNDSTCWEGYHAGYFDWFWDRFLPVDLSDAELEAFDVEFQNELAEFKHMPIVLDSVETMQNEGC